MKKIFSYLAPFFRRGGPLERMADDFWGLRIIVLGVTGVVMFVGVVTDGLALLAVVPFLILLSGYVFWQAMNLSPLDERADPSPMSRITAFFVIALIDLFWVLLVALVSNSVLVAVSALIVIPFLVAGVAYALTKRIVPMPNLTFVTLIGVGVGACILLMVIGE